MISQLTLRNDLHLISTSVKQRGIIDLGSVCEGLEIYQAARVGVAASSACTSMGQKSHSHIGF